MFRVVAVYGIVAFVIIQIVEITFLALHIPDWAQSLVETVLLLGLPAAVGLAWAFNVTPEGVQRTRPVVREPSWPPIQETRLVSEYWRE